MAKKTEALSKYRSIMAEADKLADQAAGEIRVKAKEHLAALKELGEEYEYLTGKELPELGRTTSKARSNSSTNAGSKPRGKRAKLKGAFADLTVNDAIVKAIKGKKNGLGPADVAAKIGGNKNTVTVAMSNMARDGTIKRVARGLYTA